MTTTKEPKISLEQARALVASLEQGDTEQANQIIDQAVDKSFQEVGSLLNLDSDLFEQIGKMTRQLHTALNEFQLDDRITELAHTDMPDAQSRLNYVIEMTEKAANKTMDAVEFSLPVADKLNESFANLLPRWQSIVDGRMPIDDFKSLCQDTHTFLKEANDDTSQLNGKLTDVLMAQDFQDLTGQVIRRVINLVREVEDNLIHMLKVFGDHQSTMAQAESVAPAAKVTTALPAIEAEGPVIDAEERTDVVSGQDEVDDLLSSLGF
ncbi:protein phosphatase CheZ [Neiella marina]|uniref:Protein phosphatase CheZ n=1 Tax=Neiella holothuriorum TaxID=2870530 RepID=A0ABS7EEL6_9GAMM|nr:protein phosphatase CheZ [Neiella holothuriorum]MBW8190787.1 protein phosphatase CheZ [Neiella holothuriorum]